MTAIDKIDPDLLTTYGDPRLPTRFWTKVRPDPTSGCLEWTGATNPRDNLPRYFIRISPSGHPVLRTSARVVWEALIGPLPPRVHVRHACGNRLCVRLAHLRPCRVGSNAVALAYLPEAVA